MKKEYSQAASYPLRLEHETRAKLEAIAKANGRSLNAEIVIRLEETLLKDGDAIAPSPTLAIDEMRRIALEVVKEELAKLGK